MGLQLWDPNEDLLNQISGTSTPKYTPSDLDSGTKGLIQESVNRAQTPYQSSNIDQSASQFMPHGPSQAQAQGGLLSAPGAGQAIANKYSQIAGEKLQGMKAEQGRTDKEHEFSRTGMAFNNAMVQQQVQNQNYEAYLQQIKNEQQIRANTLNTILGGGAQVAGGALGGASKKKYGNPSVEVGEGDVTNYSTNSGASLGPNYGNGSGNNPSWGGSIG